MELKKTSFMQSVLVRIPLLFLVLRRNETVESEDKREDKDVDGVLTDVSCEREDKDVDGDEICDMLVILDGDDDGSSETDDGSSKTDEFDGDCSSETDEVDDGSSITDKIGVDSSEG